ncbi:MAG: FHA domain-containing protein [Myxococcales bacterium]|nr:FHA domain-containing protein [Myxococcales bacterium]
MGLHEDLEILKQEKAGYVDRLQKLDERKDKVRPELFTKLKSELDEKLVDVDTRLAEVEQAILAEQKRLEEERRREEERLAEEKRQEEEKRRKARQQRKLTPEQLAAQRAEREAARRRQVLADHADEIAGLQRAWEDQREGKRREFVAYLDSRRQQAAAFQGKINDAQMQIEELNLRREIGEFEDDPKGYDELAKPLLDQIAGHQAEIARCENDLRQAEQQMGLLAQMSMPEFEPQILEKYADELQEPEEEIYEPEEEIYEPDESGEARVLKEEEIDGESLDDDEEILTEYEEIYEDEAEESFFTKTGFVTTTINPCLIERQKSGKTRVHELIMGGGKTLIGSSETCDVFLSRPEVDSKHAWIKSDRKSQFMVKDLGSRAGTFVNGQRIKKTLLKNGDLLRVGTVEMTVKLV